MVPNGTTYSNYPPFATNGTKTPPGGSPESAKYALGMVPADTFPAEWANYLFHGATAGITRLNADTGSIKKEINTVLSNFNITPDATLNNQLMAALNKLKAEAALAAHPVGSLYWTNVNENPAVTFGGGTWVQIKDKFILAAGDTYTNGATGGAATVTLTENEMPSHTHTFTGDIVTTYDSSITETGPESSHTHSFPHTHNILPQGYIASTPGGKDNRTLGMDRNETGYFPAECTHISGYTDVEGNVSTIAQRSSTLNTGSNDTTLRELKIDVSHNHNAYFTGEENATISQSTSTTGPGLSHSHSMNHVHRVVPEGTNSSTGGGQAHNNMPPYIVKYCWQRTA